MNTDDPSTLLALFTSLGLTSFLGHVKGQLALTTFLCPHSPHSVRHGQLFGVP